MARTNYGKVGGRRSGSGLWQWVLLTVVVTLACSAIVVFGLLIAGILSIGEDDGTSTAALVTNTPFVVTATTDPLNPTQTPFIITATSEPTEEISVQQVQPPTATEAPTQGAAEPTEEIVPPTNTPETVQQQSVGATGEESQIPALLAPLISDLVPIDGGTFQMGTTPQEIAIAVNDCIQRDGGACVASDGDDSGPPHSVTLDPFRIERTEVTLAQYVAFLNSMGAGSHLNGCDGTKCIDTQRENENSVIVFDSANYSVPDIFSNFPASGVTWYGAQSYCRTIGRRLPTEAEWERAARGLNNFLYPWGNDWVRAYARVRVPAEEASDLAGEVGSIPQNVSSFGVQDMAGNVAEWVSDFYQADYYLQNPNGVNPQGPPSGTTKVVRGGSWNTPPFFTRTVHRQEYAPTDSLLFMGFRCADEVPDPNATSGAVDPLDLGADVNTTTEEEVPAGAAPTLPPRPTPAGEATSVPDLPPDAGSGG
ncbi:MAG: SUMF1/EgtB/PvdO family nonheme iron enzyme [Aggregatilineales bacterium]